jgi:endonuclease/exonuclease/phosphatase family metal-dependent hydrolase
MTSTSGTLRVMCWNIRHGLGNDGCVDLQRIARVIRESGAQIVALQEVDRGWARSGGADQASDLADALGMHHVFAANLVLPDAGYGIPAEYGTAILSEWPIASSSNAALPARHSSERRGLLTASITHPERGELVVACTHLHWGSTATPAESIAERAEQVAAIIETLQPAPAPTLLMGDFNAAPDSPELAALRDPASGFRDAWALVHGDQPGYTIPIDHPARRIDHIWLGDGVTCSSIRVQVTADTRLASDHFPVVADLTLTP